MFLYASGEPIQKGDRIRYADGDGVVEFVADRDLAHPDTEYFVEELGGGCMILTEKFGSVFLNEPHDAEHLEFVSRARR